MDRNRIIAIAAILIILSAIVKVFHLPGSHFANNVMRIALISGIAFLVIDRYRDNKSKKDE
jgi:hypothetical protein